ncbi:right-handed parallel beta-helix repeat-containing protein, partial [Planctomycetota bacterium]
MASSNDLYGNGGLFRSVNTGDSFTSLSTGAVDKLPLGAVSDLVGDPGDQGRLYAAVLPTINPFTGEITTQGGIFTSSDHGIIWSDVTDVQLSDAINAPAEVKNGWWTGTNNIEMAVHYNASGPTTAIYIGAIFRGQANGFFRSDDYGATWTAMDLPQTDEGGVDPEGLQPRVKPGHQGAKHFSIAADPTNEYLVYAGGDRQPGPLPNSIGAEDWSGRLFRGDASVAPTGGVPSPQWTSLTHVGTSSNSAPHADSREMVFDAAGNMIEVDDGGIYKRTSPTSSSGDWYSINGNLQVMEAHSIAYDNNTDTIIVGTQDIGTPEQDSAGDLVWRTVTKGDGGVVAVDDSAADESIRYSSYYDWGTFHRRTMDTDNNETADNNVQLEVAGTGGYTLFEIMDYTIQFYQKYELNVVNPAYMIAGTDYLYESTDRGDTLTSLGGLDDLNSDTLDNDGDGATDEGDEFLPLNPIGETTAIAYGGYLGVVGNDDVLYVGNDTGDVYVRTAGGGMPALTTAAFPGAEVRGIVLDPDDYMTAYVISPSGAYVTDDAGASWTNITGNLPATELRSIDIVTTLDYDVILVGGREGVFATSPATEGYWNEIGVNMPNAPIWDMDYDSEDDFLVATALGRGVWSIADATDALLGEISGIVWADTDGDGIQDGFESGLSGVTVELYTSGDVYVDSDVTDGSGNYQFEPEPGEYYVKFTEPTVEHALSPQDQGGDDTLDSDPDRLTGKTINYMVAPDQIYDDIDAGMLVPDRFEDNDSFATAADMGALPGVHINYLTISAEPLEPVDEDWYRLELLKPDIVDVTISFTHTFGDLSLEITDDVGAVLDSSTGSGDTETVTLNSGSAGTFYVHVFGVGSAVNVYNIAMDPNASSTTTMYYVNDSSLVNDYYTLAVGDDLNTGLSHLYPKATVQSVLDVYDLGDTDMVVIDTGTYTTNVQIVKDDESAAYAGTPDGSSFNGGDTRWELIDSDFNIIYLVTFGGANSGTGIYVHGDVVDDSINNLLRDNIFTGTTTAINIIDGTDNTVENNTVSGSGSYGIYLQTTTNAIVRSNTISGRNIAIYTNNVVNPVIDINNVSSGQYGIYLTGSTTGAQVSDNIISGYSYDGINVYSATNTIVRGNEVSLSSDGIESRNSTTQLYDNDIHENTVGFRGYGIFGAVDWASGLENDVYDNTTVGVWPRGGATVRFNRIHGNPTGIYVPEDNIEIHHNVIFRNTSEGIHLYDGDNINIYNNTIYTPAGDGIKLENFSSNVTLRNNIIWVEGSYDINVATDSQIGFDSDYNNLFASGTGKVVWWQKDFDDLFDWQVEADYDTHSIGYTSLHTTLDDPQFINRAGNDYHLTDVVSTSIDAGDPTFIFPNEPGPHPGDRINLGAYGNTAQAAQSPTYYIAVDYPNFYTDWQVDTAGSILWHSYNITGNVDIKLHEVAGPTITLNTSPVDVTVGNFNWTPSSAPAILAGSPTAEYYIEIVSTTPAVTDESREYFKVPTNSTDYYIDDLSNTDDEYTPGGIGDNRNTGTHPDYPKANLLPLLRNYDLGPGDTIKIDTGNYNHVRNVILSGGVGLGDDEGAIYTGPLNLSEDPAVVAVIDRDNPYTQSTNIDITDGDFVTLKKLTLTGAERGLWVHNGSTNFTGEDLIVEYNALDGIIIEADAAASTVTRLTAHDNTRDGIVILTPIGTLEDGFSYSNGRYGIYLTANTLTGSGTLVSNNEVYDNTSHGIYATVNYSYDTITIKNNKVHDNLGYGIYAYNDVVVNNNTVYNQPNYAGILLYNAAADSNVVHSNYDGIEGHVYSSNTITNNRTYNNTRYGIFAYNGTDIIENTSYSNATGIVIPRHNLYSGDIDNNLVYANSADGIVLNYAGGSSAVTNNTVFQDTGDALRIQDSSQNVEIRNNILWASSATGHGLYVANDSQTGFSSDYNIFYLTDPVSGTGNVGYWQSSTRASLVDWQNASFQDDNSMLRDPLFVDPDGADSFFGYVDPVNDGRDDDFHLKSEYGSYTGGSLAPVLDAGTGLPVVQAGVWTNYPTEQSPGIDRGDATYPYSLEPLDNGGYINIGTYGNTDQASKSPAEYVLVLRPDEGEVWPAEQTFPIRWRSDIMDYTYYVPGNASDYYTEVMTENPVGYWRLNETVASGTTANDSSTAGTNDGNYENGVTQDVTAYLIGDSAAEFDASDDRVSVPDDGSLKPAAISLEAWIKPDTGIGTYDSVIMKSTNSGWTDGYGLYYSGGNLIFFVNNYSTASVAAPITLDQWSYVVATYSVADGELRLYINDNAPVTAAYSTTITHTTNSLLIGQGTGSNGYTWKGRLDEVAIYDTALTPAQVSDHYNASLGTVTEVDIELINSGGGPGYPYSIAAGELNDGEYLWYIDDTLLPPNPVLPDSNFKVRITRTDDPLLTDESDNVFEIEEPIHVYWVNDGSVHIDGNDWTTNPGDAGNDGLSPAAPKDSVKNVLETYDLGPGDIIKVDNGSYLITSNILITAADVGITIEGYNGAAYPGRVALLDRDNTAQDVFEISTSGVTLSYLHITGGLDGVSATDADGLTVSYCEIYDNDQYGIEADAISEGVDVNNSVFYGTARYQNYGIVVRGPEPTITENTVYDHYYEGIYVDTNADNAVIDDNEVYGNRTGLYVDRSAGAVITRNQTHNNFSHGMYVYGHSSEVEIKIGDGTVAGMNVAYNNTNDGIRADGKVQVWKNHAYGQTGTNDAGIYLKSGAEAKHNEADNNFNGIVGYTYSTVTITENHAHDNISYGIAAYNDSDITGNTSNANAVGIGILQQGFFTGSVANNLVYLNTTNGIVIQHGGSGGSVANNTVYQLVGDALQVENTSQYLSVRNNILWVEDGSAIKVADDSQTGFDSDFNFFKLGAGAGAYLGTWEGVNFDNRVDWFYELGLDANSLVGDPLFIDLVDFELQLTSPAIDKGEPFPAFAYANEPTPNGERINIGRYGNTPDAAVSPAELTQVLAPNGLEKFEFNELTQIQWRTVGLLGTSIDIELIDASSGLPVGPPIATGITDDGNEPWTVPDTLLEGEYRIKVSATTGTLPSDESDENFLIVNDSNQYYVNDSTVLGGDITFAPGDNANSGKDTYHPVASLRTLLAAYDLDSGDVINVDNGSYQVIKNIVVGTEDGGVDIIGFNSTP